MVLQVPEYVINHTRASLRLLLGASFPALSHSLAYYAHSRILYLLL